MLCKTDYAKGAVVQKIRVGVLMGGKSIEKEVSFNSGRTVCEHLDSTRYDIIPLFQKQNGALYLLPWHFLSRGKTNDFVERLEGQAKRIKWDDLKSLVDFMYIAMHGRYAEDGTMQGFLEVLGIPYLGSKIFASALCMDKVIVKQFLARHGIAVPKGIALTPQEVEQFAQNKDHIIAQLTALGIQLPYVVKPNKEGSSFGVSIVFDFANLEEAVKTACYIQPGTKEMVLIEEKLEGMEFACTTITDYMTNTLRPLPPTEIVPEEDRHFFDYDQKYMPGRALKITPPTCSPTLIKKIQETCIKTMQVLGITNLSRIDGFVTNDGRIVIMDPNTFSGMDPACFLFREAAEIDMSSTQLINHLIETECYQYGMLEPIINQSVTNGTSYATK